MITASESSWTTPFTGLSPGSFRKLVTLLQRQGADAVRKGRPWSLPLEDRVLLITVYWRTNLTMRQLALLFGVSKSAADRIIDHLGPLLDRAQAGGRARCELHRHRRVPLTTRSANGLISRALAPYPEDLTVTTKVWPGRGHLSVVSSRVSPSRRTGSVGEYFGALAELRGAGLIRYLGMVRWRGGSVLGPVTSP